MVKIRGHGHIFASTRSPFLTWLSRRAQSGRRSFFVKRAWFTELNIVLVIYVLLVVLFTQYILDAGPSSRAV